MTISKCMDFCLTNSFLYAGLQLSNECHCTNSYPTRIVPDHECSLRCTGDNDQLCGGFQRRSVYSSVSKVIACPVDESNLGIAKIFCKRGFIDIIGALYGRLNNETCNNNSTITITCNSTVDHNLFVKSSCNGKKLCLYEGTTNQMGDPCPGALKYTEIKYRCIHSNHMESERLKLFCVIIVPDK